MTSISRAVRPFFVAKRPDFSVGSVYYEEELEFEWHKGMSWQVRQRSSISFASEIERKYPSIAGKILEVSTKSTSHELGVALSATALSYIDPGTGATHSVESWFQAAKHYINNNKEYGPYKELLVFNPKIAKRYLNQNLTKDLREQYEDDPLFEQLQREIKDSVLLDFVFLGEKYPLDPKSAFYDYLYSKALYQKQNLDLSKEILCYSVFTDIEFNPKKNGKVIRYNTQARACAIYVALSRRELLSAALEGFESFIECVNYSGSDLPSNQQIMDEQMRIEF